MKKKCKRKHWHLIDPVAHAIAGASITDQQSLNKLRLRELSGIEAMSKGQGTIYDWQSLVDMLNICEMMALQGIGPEALVACNIAQESLAKAAKRYETIKRMGLFGEGIQAVREVYDYHDLQRTSISRSEYERMIDKTRKHLQSRSELVTVL
mgnify:CR=1 FL=1|tara:strand:+ start:1146 stop:1601 length:456 start_codon:yes stop_codon:yes gene_type:complete